MSEAEDTAISIVGWLAGQPDLLGRFLALSGLTADGLRAASKQPGFLVGVLTFLMNHEPTLMAFCADTGAEPESIGSAYRALAGDDGHDQSI